MLRAQTLCTNPCEWWWGLNQGSDSDIVRGGLGKGQTSDAEKKSQPPQGSFNGITWEKAVCSQYSVLWVGDDINPSRSTASQWMSVLDILVLLSFIVMATWSLNGPGEEEVWDWMPLRLTAILQKMDPASAYAWPFLLGLNAQVFLLPTGWLFLWVFHFLHKEKKPQRTDT